MFGLKAFFAALARLTSAVHRSADLFESANEHLARQLGFEETPPALPESGAENKEEVLPAPRNGRRAKV